MLSRQCSAIAKRFASSAAKPRGNVAAADEQISRLPNGLTVGSVDNGGAVSQLVLAFRAGSRYEQPDEAGLVHHLRNAIGTDSRNYLGTHMLWQCGSAGANLVASMSRDVFAVQLSVVREHAGIGASLLGELAQPAFKPWDIEETVPSLRIDRAYLQPFEVLSEKLHYAAFRNGALGNGIFAKNSRIGKIGYKKLIDFAASRLVTGQGVIVGVNVDHGEILGYAKDQMALTEAPGHRGSPSAYIGGEVRHPADGPLAHVAIAGKGASLHDPKGMAIHAVLSCALGQGPSTKYSVSVGSGVVAKAVQNASNGDHFGLSAISEIYADAGLVGVYLVAHGDRMGPLVNAAVAALKTFSIDDAALLKAKRMASLNILNRYDCSSERAMDLAANILATGAAPSVSDLLAKVDSVTAAEVTKGAQQMASKLTIASHGNIYQVPYLDQL